MNASPVRFLSPPGEQPLPSLELAGLLYLPDRPGGRPAPGLVVGHGAGSNAARHTAFCLAACGHGFVVLALDFRGHGDSEGRGDGPLELDLASAALFLRRRPEVDPCHIFYRGSSMGGFYGLKAAPEAGFAALALVCPADETTMLRSIDRGDDAPRAGPLTRWDGPGLRAYFERQDSRAVAARVSCPVLLVHARGDEVVPFAHSLLLARHLQVDTTLIALKGGTHTTAQHDPSIHDVTVAWLLKKRR